MVLGPTTRISRQNLTFFLVVLTLALHFFLSAGVVVQSLSRVWLFLTPWIAAHQAFLSFISQSLLKLMPVESLMPSNYLTLCCPLRVFSNEFTLEVQGTLKSLLQHDWRASVLQCSAFSVVQLSHLYATTGKTIALTIWTFVSKVMSLIFNTLSRFVIAFFPRSISLISNT